MTKAEIEKVISQAKSWLGITEYDGRFIEIVNTYNEIPGARGPALVSYPWCAIFVSAVFWKAIRESRFAEMACDAMIQKFQNLGLYSVSGKPDVGDVIFFDWDSNGTSDHVGIITEVTANGYTVIEGNKSDAVGYRTISASYPFIKGFGFATRLKGEETVQPTPSETVGQQMAQQVINARYTPDNEAVKENMLVPVLELYLQGKSVEAMQSLLILRKIDIGPDGADGYFGSKTYKGLCEFQTSLGRVSGKCDAYTWDKLIKGADKNDSADN